MFVRKLGFASLILALIVVGLFAAPVHADGGDFSLDFTAAAPYTYDHSTGGGAFNDRTVGVTSDIVESLEGGDFRCGDIVTYLTQIVVDAGAAGAQIIEIDYEFLGNTTGQAGIGMIDILDAKINYGPVQNGAGPGGVDSGISDDGGSVASLISESIAPPAFTNGSVLAGTVKITDLEAGETVILRIDVLLGCNPDSNPTGNLQASIDAARVVSPALDTISAGAQTIPFKQIGNVIGAGEPALEVVKTVMAAGGTCGIDDGDSLTVNKNDQVVYCYTVTNVGTATAFDVVLTDDNGTPGIPGDDFTVTLSPLVDGTDLASGANASGQSSAITMSAAGTIVNTATVVGYADAKGNGGVSAQDTASVTVNIVLGDPSMSVVKTALPTSLPEPGGVVTFTVQINNDSDPQADDTDPITVISIVDAPYGDLTDGSNLNLVSTTCVSGQVIDPGDSYTCKFAVDMLGSQPGDYDDTVSVIAKDDENVGVSAQDDATVTITDVPSVLNVAKSVDKSSLPEPGGDFVYTATISSPAGNVDGIAIDGVVDSVYGALTPADCGLGSFGITLLPGNTLTCVFTINHTGNAGASWTNQISVVAFDDDGADKSKLSNEVTVNLTNVPSSLVLEKDVTPNALDEPGGDVTYTIRVTNTSTVDAVTITSFVDDKFTIDVSECDYGASLPTLQPGEGFSCTFTRAVSGAPAAAFVNTATAQGTDDDNQPVSAQDNATVTFNDVASSLDVLKTANPSSMPEPGGDVTYTVRVTNTSTTDSVTINSVIDDKFGDVGASCNPAVGSTLAPGAAMTCVFVEPITGNAGFSHINTVVASGTDDDGKQLSDQDDATVTITNVPSSIDVTKTANVSELLEPGGDVQFTVVVKNTSNVDNVTINSVIDDKFGDIGASCSPAVGSSLAPNESMTCVFTRTITGNAGFVHVNEVTATGVDDDQQPVSGSDTENVAIDDVASSIKVTKTADVSSVNEPGSDVTFTVLIENTSAEDAVTIDNLSDDVYGDVDGSCTPAIGSTLQPGQVMTCVFTGPVTGNAGDVHVNTATATGTDDDENPLSDSDSETVNVLDVPSSIAVTKTADPTSLPEPGGDVDYTVVVRNTSAVDDVTINSVIDDKFGDVSASCGTLPAVLAPNATLTCTFVRPVTGNAGATHVNVATANGVDDDGNSLTANDNASVGITNLPSSIAVTKTANPTQVPETGGDVTFTVVVRNTSAVDNVTIQTVTDDKLGDLSAGCAVALPTVLTPNQTLTCSVTKFLAGDFNTNHVNVATATGVDDDGTPVSDDDDATVRFSDVGSSIRVTKTANVDTATLQGQNVQFTVLVENTSPVDTLTITAIDDDIYGDILDAGNSDIVSTTCVAGETLPVGGSYSCTFVAFVSGTALGEVHRNTVTVEGEDDDGGVTTDQDDATVEVGQPIIEAFKSSEAPQGRDRVAPGETLEYTIVIRNTGNRPAENVVLDDTIDPNTTLVAGTVRTSKGTVITEDVASGNIVIDIGDMAAGSQVTIQFDVTISLDPASLQILNQGVVLYDDPDEPESRIEVLTDDPRTLDIDDGTGNIIEGPTAIYDGEEPLRPGTRFEVFLPFTSR